MPTKKRKAAGTPANKTSLVQLAYQHAQKLKCAAKYIKDEHGEQLVLNLNNVDVDLVVLNQSKPNADSHTRIQLYHNRNGRQVVQLDVTSTSQQTENAALLLVKTELSQLC